MVLGSSEKVFIEIQFGPSMPWPRGVLERVSLAFPVVNPGFSATMISQSFFLEQVGHRLV